MNGRPEKVLRQNIITTRQDSTVKMKGGKIKGGTSFMEEDAMIGDNAFENCMNLKSIEISGYYDSLHHSPSEYNIGENTFKGCINLKTVVIKKQLGTIKSNAFENCLNLIEISLPSVLSNIEDKAFKGCVSLSQIKNSFNGDYPEELKKILNSYF